MKNRDALCQLVIRNMEVIEEAPKIVERAERELFDAINTYIKKYVSNNADWSGYYDLVTGEKDDTYFAPAAWANEEDGGFNAWYALYTMSDDDEAYWISHALGVQGNQLVFLFNTSNELVNMKKKEKEKLIKTFYDATPELERAGFLYDGGVTIYLPFFFDAGAVAEEFPNFDGCLAPLDGALKALFTVHPKFDAFVKELVAKL